MTAMTTCNKIMTISYDNKPRVNNFSVRPAWCVNECVRGFESAGSCRLQNAISLYVK